MVVKRSFQSRLVAHIDLVVMLALTIVAAIGVLIATPSVAGVYDPMRPQAGLVAAESVTADHIELHLEATMISALRRVAIIDGSTVNVGDLYQGYRVASIDEGSVVLAQRGEKTSLTLQPTIITRTNHVTGTLHHIRGVD